MSKNQENPSIDKTLTPISLVTASDPVWSRFSSGYPEVASLDSTEHQSKLQAPCPVIYIDYPSPEYTEYTEYTENLPSPDLKHLELEPEDLRLSPLPDGPFLTWSDLY